MRAQLITLQEELDWQCYADYGLTDTALVTASPPPLQLGQRAFEIVLARKLAAGHVDTQWFARHGSTPITDLPADWPDDYRALVERRIAEIESNRDVALIEQPEYKRRWATEPWEDQQQRALRHWLLDRLEHSRFWPEPELTTTARLAERVADDPDFLRVAALYRGRDDFDLAALVEELVLDEAVPFLPALRYKPPGLRKRAQWEETWQLQRREDAGETVTDIPVPPKYKSSDFLKPAYWRLRGKLDVPKERFVLYPHCERQADPSPVIGWAGHDHLQRAHAIAAYVADVREREAWERDRLIPLYAGLLDLMPWLFQWHDELPPGYDTSPAHSFHAYLQSELREQGLTEQDLRDWQPPKRKATRRRRAKS